MKQNGQENTMNLHDNDGHPIHDSEDVQRYFADLKERVDASDVFLLLLPSDELEHASQAELDAARAHVENRSCRGPKHRAIIPRRDARGHSRR